MLILESLRSGSKVPPGFHVGMPGCNTLWYCLLFALVEEDICIAGACQSVLAFLARLIIPRSAEGKRGVAALGAGATADKMVALLPVSYFTMDMI